MTVTDHSRARKIAPAVGGFLLLLTLYTMFYTEIWSANVTVRWSYDFTPEPPCSTPGTVRCVDHFEVQDITKPGKTLLIQTVGNPVSAEGEVNNISTSFRYGPPYGRRTISVIAVGRNSRGERITSNPFAARMTVSVWPKAKGILSRFKKGR